MKVAELMKVPVRTCGQDDDLNTAARIMWEHDCGCVPVVDAEQRVVGVITDRDVCMAAYTKGRTLNALRVGDAMATPAYTCRADDTIANAARMMRLNQVHRLPIIDAADRLVGILSLNDLAQEARTAAASHKRHLSFAEVGETLESVCRPRPPHMVSAGA